ncbi:MAG: hypothetical protein RL398_15 [Planctomycetota bacterium]|jgi:hypothetical protein
MQIRAITALPLLLLAACATSVATESGTNAAAKQAELRDFQERQWMFREQNTTPQVFDFPGQGRVTVREISLDGFPGSAYLRCRFHFQNRAEKPIVQTWVSLDVLDAEGRMVGSQATVCIVPHPIAIARGAYFADELRTQTFDAHMQPGWSWRIRCSSQMEEEDEPLSPPVPEPEHAPGVSKPLIIKDRGQRRSN